MGKAVLNTNNDKTGIKTVYADLKKKRVVLTWAEFSEKIGYDRTYISRVLNGHEPVSAELRKAIKDFVEAAKNVSRETNDASNDQMLYTTPTLTENGARLKDHKNENPLIFQLEERVKAIEKELKENNKILMQLQAFILQKM